MILNSDYTLYTARCIYMMLENNVGPFTHTDTTKSIWRFVTGYKMTKGAYWGTNFSGFNDGIQTISVSLRKTP